MGDLVDQATAGLQDIQEWLSGPPFNLGEDQVGQAVDDAINSLQENAQSIAGAALTGATVVGNSLLNLILALLLAFFFLKDGPRWVPWLSAQTGPRAAPHVAALSLEDLDDAVGVHPPAGARRVHRRALHRHRPAGSSASRWCSRWRC